MKSILTLLAIMAIPLNVAAALADSDVAKNEVETWRAGRLERLHRPEGWLSLVGLHWVEPGKHSVGSAADNGIVLATGPAHLGDITLEGKRATFSLAQGAAATFDGVDQRSGELSPDTSEKPTKVHFGSASFILIERGGRYALRVWDSEAKTRTGFVGLDYYENDPSWRVAAKFEPHPQGATIEVANVLGTLEPMVNSGVVTFEHGGKKFRLEAIDEGDGQLFLVFGDRSNGKETYGAGRFLYAAPPAAGSDAVVIDFNKSYNPPCVFTPYATCPLPPPGNRLDAVVTAGEKKYRGATH
jgi:uncharacterized protein (DUF1684 family)